MSYATSTMRPCYIETGQVPHLIQNIKDKMKELITLEPVRLFFFMNKTTLFDYKHAAFTFVAYFVTVSLSDELEKKLLHNDLYQYFCPV